MRDFLLDYYIFMRDFLLDYYIFMRDLENHYDYFWGFGTKPRIATKQLINGLMMLKKQKGRYTNVGMPSTVLCVIPQAVQGTSTEVTVAESSVLRLSNSGR